MMLTATTTEQPRTSFRGPLDGLEASQPSNQTTAEVLQGLGSGDGSGAIKVLRDLDEMIRQEFG